MRGRNKTLRSVVYDDVAVSEKDRFIGQNNVECQFIGIEWLLARTPEIGELQKSKLVNNLFVHVAKEDTVAKTDKVWVLYSYNEKEVCIHGLKIYNS